MNLSGSILVVDTSDGVVIQSIVGDPSWIISLELMEPCSVADLLASVASDDGSVQTYRVLDDEGNPKTEGNIVTGFGADEVEVTAEDGTTKQIYALQEGM